MINAKTRILVSRTKNPMDSDDTASLDVAGFLAKLSTANNR